MIPLLQTKTADTAHTGILQVTPGPFPDFWVGPGDEATRAGSFNRYVKGNAGLLPECSISNRSGDASS